MNRAGKITAAAIAAFGALISPMKISAQSDASFTQYWAIPTYYNPAATGTTDYIRIRGGARLQWVGIENAPRTFMASGDMPVKIGKKRIGVGLLFNQESIGLFNNLGVNAQVSYKFKFLKGVWSVGLQPGYYNTKFKGSEIYIPEGDDYHQPDDQDLPKNDVSGNAFDISAGVHYSHKYFSVGASVLHITQPKITLGSEGGSDQESVEYETVLPRMAYFTADGNIPIKNTLFSLQPSLLVRTDFSNFSADITMRATYKNFISFGVGYRYKDAVSAMIAAEYKNFFLGYAYDYPMSAISKASSGSHEIVAGYQIRLNYGEKNKNKHRSIRIM
ncbi:MAG: type IX secretion system membrane protein PorP/SprF [Candidatus Amulumruptor caecigallinarius]|nr:type IX secretion system membrane protein PorP/SprF [Candidatus Amulumruptor caecigallinarius]